ncbi:MAG: hypothetical protein FJ271_07780 [Planctomycetes bacterium]|nr:hypothetical protein [Planctomycetota bacterium]
MDEAPADRQMHGFARTRCGCERCRVPCRHVPGGLDVADLDRLCPEGRDLFVWAEEHLRARIDKPYPVLVPARQANGHCHWLFEGKCVVHEHAPYGCAYFDTHMSADESRRRYAATVRAREQDAAEAGLYFRLWERLRDKGLIEHPPGCSALDRDFEDIQRQAERARRRLSYSS